MTASRKKLFVKTFGCQMNVYDSGRMIDALAGEGFDSTDTMDEADLVILNTCHIREKAAEKVYSEIGRIRAREGGAPEGRQGHDDRRGRLRRPGRGRRRSSAGRPSSTW